MILVSQKKKPYLLLFLLAAFMMPAIRAEDVDPIDSSETVQNAKSDELSEQLDKAVRSGRMGPLEAEYVKLVRTRKGDPMVRRNAIHAWIEAKGELLKAERKARSLARATTVKAARKEMEIRRKKHISEALRNGRIGPLEAELMTLRQNQGQDASANLKTRQEAIKAWCNQKGTALIAEREAGKAVTKKKLKGSSKKAKSVRLTQIDEAVHTGRIGPLEAELMKLSLQDDGDPQSRRDAIRVWQQQKGAALKLEQQGRREKAVEKKQK